MFDAMARAISAHNPQFTPQQLSLQPLQFAEYQGMPVRDFDGSMFDMARERLGQAVEMDRDRATSTYDNLRNTLQQGFSNPYDSSSWARNPEMSGAMQRMLAANAGGMAEGGHDAWAEGRNADAAFGNVLALLGAGEQQRHASRLNQTHMDTATALQRIAAQELGLGTGIDMSRARAHSGWQQRADERAYQDHVTGQTWGRDAAMYNHGIENQAAMHNNDLANQAGMLDYQFQSGRLQPILDLIGMAGGAGHELDYDSLIALLGGG